MELQRIPNKTTANSVRTATRSGTARLAVATNHRFQQAVSHNNQQLGRQLLAEAQGGRIHLTQKQVDTLRGMAIRLSSNRTTPQARPRTRADAVALKQEVVRDVHNAFARLISGNPAMRMAFDTRGSPAYYSLWLSLGMPPSMPAPYPRCMGNTLQSRYRYVRNGTAVTAFTVPAGEVSIIMLTPAELTNPLRAWTTTTAATVGAPVTAFAWDRSAGNTDQTNAATTSAGWINTDLWDPWIDANAIKSAGHTHPPVTSARAPLCAQIMGTRIDVQIGVPYNGICFATVLSPGTNNAMLGPGAEHVMHDLGGSYGIHGYPAEFMRHARYPPGITATQTPIQISQRFATPIMCAGGSSSASQYMRAVSAGTSSWEFVGRLDGTDAPDAGVTSFQQSMTPRDNFCHKLPYGMIVINNSGGAAAVVATMSAEVVAAVVLQSDDSVTAIGALASMTRNDSPLLVNNQMSRPQVPRPVIANSSAGLMEGQALQAMGFGATPQAVRGASTGFHATATPSHSADGTMQRLEDQGEAMLATHGAMQMIKSTETGAAIMNRIESAAGGAARSVGSFVASSARSAWGGLKGGVTKFFSSPAGALEVTEEVGTELVTHVPIP